MREIYKTAFQGGSYGEGVIFKLTVQGGYAVLHNFGDPNDPNDGVGPIAGLVLGSDGNLYGATSAGGTLGFGIIFQATLAGNYSVLHNLDGTDGAVPSSTPVQHTNGKIYGMASQGGTSNLGVIYVLDLGLRPFIRLVSASGKVGQTGGILGQGFTGTTCVSLNGTPASFTVVSDTFIRATVPPGATTGFVTVVTPSGTLTSNQEFHVLP